jgi:transcriptional regulator with XRE-family HTH domain
MALFFDSQWFEAKLAAVHLSRDDLARALGLSDSEIAELWKDQRELSTQDVALIANLLGVTATEVAYHAGVSTPVPAPANDLSARLDRIEALLAEIKTLLAKAGAR